MIDSYTLYRAYNSDGDLLYVGATIDISKRLRDHRHRGSSWWSEVATVKIEHFATSEELLEAEKFAIMTEGPRDNEVHLKPAFWAMKPRGPRGEGSVYQRRDGMWVGSVELPPGKDGKRRQKRVTSKSREVAEQKFAELKRQLGMTA